jgi:hypothetical protein
MTIESCLRLRYRRLRRHLTLAVAAAPTRLETEPRGLRALLEYVRANPDLYRVVAASQFVDQAVLRRYYEEFAASYRKSLRATEAKGEIRRGVRAGCEGADGAEEVSIPPKRAADAGLSSPSPPQPVCAQPRSDEIMTLCH